MTAPSIHALVMMPLHLVVLLCRGCHERCSDAQNGLHTRNVADARGRTYSWLRFPGRHVRLRRHARADPLPEPVPEPIPEPRAARLREAVVQFTLSRHYRPP